MDKNLIPWWLVVATILAIGMAISVSGCADLSLQAHEERHCEGWTHTDIPQGQTAFRYEWKKVRDASERPWLYVNVDNPNQTCRALGSQAAGNVIISGCAIWQPSNCIIILPN